MSASIGTAKTMGKGIPELNGKLTGITFHVPIFNMSIMELTCHLEKAAKYNGIQKAVKQASGASWPMLMIRLSPVTLTVTPALLL